MKIRQGTRKLLSLFLTLVLIMTTIPSGVFAADEDTLAVPDSENFKYMRMTGTAVRSPISTNGLFEKENNKEKENLIYRPVNITQESALIEFSLEYNQGANIMLYKIKPSVLTGEDNDKMPNPYPMETGNELDFLGEPVGVIEAVHIKENINTSNPEKAVRNKDFSAEDLLRLASEARNTSPSAMSNEYFYGFTGIPIPDNLPSSRMRSLSLPSEEETSGSAVGFSGVSAFSDEIATDGALSAAEEAEFLRASQIRLAAAEADTKDFIHNILVWGGGIVGYDEYEYETGMYVLAVEPTDPRTSKWKSYLGIYIDVDHSPEELSLLDYSELPEICLGDPVNMLTGSFTWNYRELLLPGRTDLEFSRHYESVKAGEEGYDFGFGKGYTTNFTYKVVEDTIFSKVIMPNGDNLYFDLDFDGSYKSSAGSSFSFAKTGSGYRLTHKDGTVYSFNSDGDILHIDSPDGEDISYSYSGGKLSSVTADAGTYSFTWSGDHISSVTDNAGGTVRYSYAGDLLVSAENPDGDSLLYTYTASGYLSSVKDYNGTVYTENTYDDKGRVLTQNIPGQDSYTFTWDAKNRTNSIQRASGYNESVVYDEYGRITAHSDNFGTEYFEYDTLHRKTAETNRLGYRTEYGHDARGNISLILYPDGTSESFVYDGNDRVTRYTDGAGGVTNYEYDGLGNLTKLTLPSGNATAIAYSGKNPVSSTDAEGNTTLYTTDSAGNILTETDPGGGITSYSYDSKGRLIETSYPDGGIASFEYSPAGKLVKITDPAGGITSYTVNGNGYETGSIDPMGFSLSTEYNDMNKPVSVTDEEGNTSLYSYDVSGGLISSSDPEGNTVSYTYDPMGRITGMTDARGNTYTYEYDAEGRLTKTVDPTGGITRTSYDPLGRVTKETNARGAGTTYTYDGAGRTVTEQDALGSTSGNVYDANGNTVQEYDKNGNAYAYTYDGTDRLTESVDPLGNKTSYTYSANGNLTAIKSALGYETKSEYDQMGRLVKSTDAEGNETIYEYDILGRLTKTLFADGAYVLYAYDANGRLTSSAAEDGGTTAYTYSNTGQILTITDAKGGVTFYTYDKNGNVLTITDAIGGITAYTYDANGNTVSAKDARGGVTSYEYDSLDRVIKITDANGNIFENSYDANGNVTKAVNPDGGTISYSYDILDRLISYTDAEGAVFSFAYDKNGNLVSRTDGRGNTEYVSYDGLNRIKGATDRGGNTSEINYDADGRVSKTVTAKGAETSYSYDKNGNAVKVKDALGNETAISYDSLNRVSAITDARGAVTSYTYTETGNVKTITDALGGIKTYEYDLNGNMAKETNELGKSTIYTYDALNRVKTATNPLGFTDRLYYDAMGNITGVMDKNGFMTYYTYDPNGNVIETKDALGSKAFFEYDSMDRLSKVTLSRADMQDFVNTNEITLYEYDKRGLVTKEIGATGLETLYIYDENGNPVQKTDADGYITVYAREERDLVSAINYSDGRSVLFGYDADGELIAMTDPNGETTFELDLLNRIISVNDHKGDTVSYAYDTVGNQTSITYPDNTKASYEYDPLGRMTKMTDSESKNTSYAYDAASQLISQIYPNGWKEFYEYDPAGRQVRVLDINPKGWLTKKVALEYWYDATDNVIKEWKRGTGGQYAGDSTYLYDPLGRMTYAAGTWGAGATTYMYDSLGNLTWESTLGKITDYKYNDLNQQTKEIVNTFDITDYTYDNRGNLIKAEKPVAATWWTPATTKVTEAYIYDSANRLSVGVNDKGETSAYVYNGLGYRIGNIETTLKDCYGYYGFGTVPASPWFPGLGYGFGGYGAGYGFTLPSYGGFGYGMGYGYGTGYGTGYGYGVGYGTGYGYGVGYGTGYGYGTTGYGTGYGYPGYGAGYGTGYDYGAGYGYGYPGYGWGTSPAPGAGAGTQPEQPDWPFEGVTKPVFTQTIEKSFTLDYTSEDKDVILEKENGGLSFKFNYGLEKVSALIEGPTYGYCNLYVNGKAKVYFHEDRLGSTEYITDDFGGNVLSYIDYDPWGVPTNKAVVMLGFRAVDLVAEYTGHPYDNVLSAYFAEARMYDAADRRFLAADIIKGTVTNPLTLVPYTYVLDNPMKYIDILGLIGTFIELGSTYIKDSYNIGTETYYGNLSEVLGAYGAVPAYLLRDSSVTDLNTMRIGNLNLKSQNGYLTITGKDNFGRIVIPKTVATKSLPGGSNTSYVDVDYFAKLMCGFGYNKSVTKTDTLLGRGEMNELIAKYGMSQSQAQVLYKMNWYFAKNKNVNEKLKSGLAIFAFEGFGDYEGAVKATYHPEGRYGAMLVVVVDGKVEYLTANASTLPDYGLLTSADLILKDGVYGVTSHNHTGKDGSSYAALKVSTVEYAADIVAKNTYGTDGSAPVYRSTGEDRNSTGINIHMGSGNGLFDYPSRMSEGCVIIQYQDYPSFTNTIGLTSETKFSVGDYVKSKETMGKYTNDISGIFVNDRSGFSIEDYITGIR